MFDPVSPKVLKEGRKNKQSDLATPMKVRAAARAMAADTMAAQVGKSTVVTGG